MDSLESYIRDQAGSNFKLRTVWRRTIQNKRVLWIGVGRHLNEKKIVAFIKKEYKRKTEDTLEKATY